MTENGKRVFLTSGVFFSANDDGDAVGVWNELDGDTAGEVLEVGFDEVGVGVVDDVAAVVSDVVDAIDAVDAVDAVVAASAIKSSAFRWLLVRRSVGPVGFRGFLYFVFLSRIDGKSKYLN